MNLNWLLIVSFVTILYISFFYYSAVLIILNMATGLVFFSLFLSLSGMWMAGEGGNHSIVGLYSSLKSTFRLPNLLKSMLYAWISMSPSFNNLILIFVCSLDQRSGIYYCLFDNCSILYICCSILYTNKSPQNLV